MNFLEMRLILAEDIIGKQIIMGYLKIGEIMNKTDIEWCDYTWSPVTGCTPISAGCDNCYASRIANRFKGTKAFPDGFKVTLHPERLDEPSKLKGKGKRIFVCSMSDLFHDDVPDEFIDEVFGVMKANPQHTFFVLTKRPERMAWRDWAVCSDQFAVDSKMISHWYAPNIWVGVSVENQETADERIPILLDLPVAHRFVSCEPLIGPLNLEKWLKHGEWKETEEHFSGHIDREWVAGITQLEWCIVGGETGPGARKCEFPWIIGLKNQCENHVVPFFFKKWGSFYSKSDNHGSIGGYEYREWPEGV